MRTKQLRIPGPTPLPPQARQAAGRQMINHRGKEFTELYSRLEAKMKKFFQTKNDILFLTCSGTGGMEAAIVNLFSPGDMVIVASIGYFGDRFSKIAKDFGLSVTDIRKEDGQALMPEDITAAMKRTPDAKAVLLTHNETSTGVTNDLAKLAPVVKKMGKLLIVDAISSVPAIELKTDLWGADVVIAGSQKAFMAPPGLAVISVSPAAWEAHRYAKLPRHYFDFTEYRKFAEKKVTPATPAVSALLALDASTGMLLKRGLRNEFARHKKLAADFRKTAKKAGFTLFADEKFASSAVTSVMLPGELAGKTGDFITLLRDKYGIEVAPGQSALQGKIFRVGHMGFVTSKEMEQAAKALVKALRHFTSSIPPTI